MSPKADHSLFPHAKKVRHALQCRLAQNHMVQNLYINNPAGFN